MAVRLSGDRRQADRRQHSLALVRGRQAAFDASYPAMAARKEDAVDHNEQEQVALHRRAVIAEAAGETLILIPRLPQKLQIGTYVTQLPMACFVRTFRHLPSSGAAEARIDAD